MNYVTVYYIIAILNINFVCSKIQKKLKIKKLRYYTIMLTETYANCDL